MTQPVPVFAGRVTKGHLMLDDHPRFVRWLHRMTDGQRVDVTVRKPKSKRSAEQNRYWFWAMRFLAREAWGEADADAKERMHYWLLIQYFGAIEIKGYAVPKRTSRRLSTAEFSAMIEWMVQFAARDLGVVVPLPNEIDLSRYDEGAA